MKDVHIEVLKSFDELPFCVGERTLTCLFLGKYNDTIRNNNLDRLECFGMLYKFLESRVEFLMKVLLEHSLLERKIFRNNFSVIKRSELGRREIIENKHDFSHILMGAEDLEIEKVTQEDREKFKKYENFLGKFNEEQKKAIISLKRHILCIAGAGSGKTTTLTKRIDFLCRFKSVNPEQILAITFTKKAKEEMKLRLRNFGIRGCLVVTFNGFCEKMLKLYEKRLYSYERQAVSFREQIEVVRDSLKSLNISFEEIVEDYFGTRQQREKTKDELFFMFVRDVFSIISSYKNRGCEIEKFYENERQHQRRKVAEKVFRLCVEILENLEKRNLRTFTEQITNTIELFKEHNNIIPHFSHILIDEYQDINKIQIELLILLKSRSNAYIFAVGDPRQAIYGWRGSDIFYILKFPKMFKEAQILSLSHNYRSSQNIVDFFNQSIESMRMEDIRSTKKTSGKVFVIEYLKENSQSLFIINAIKSSSYELEEIFVLGRTHRILENIIGEFRSHKIPFTIKTDEQIGGVSNKKRREEKRVGVTIATIHAIKGLEARQVFLVSANTFSFPNKVQENAVLSLIKDTRFYDKEEEERRVFYVALSRAKEQLIITYTGMLTKFITGKMLGMTQFRPQRQFLKRHTTQKSLLDVKNERLAVKLLKDWRSEKAYSLGVPHYIILTNRSIEELCEKRPQTLEELEEIHGISSLKVEKYGEELMKIVSGGN